MAAIAHSASADIHRSLYRTLESGLRAALGRIKGPEMADPAEEIAVQRSAPTFGELAALFLKSQHFETGLDPISWTPSERWIRCRA